MTTLLTLGDLSSGAVAAAGAWIHGQRRPERIGLKSVVASAVGRMVSDGLTGGMFDAFISATVTKSMKDHVVGVVTRIVIVKIMNEQYIFQKDFDFLLADSLADTLIRSMGVTDQSVFAYFQGGGVAVGGSVPNAGIPGTAGTKNA
jgi:hypothetical protein